MSRIGKKLIILPSGVDVMLDGTAITVKGGKGELKRDIDARVRVEEIQTDAGEKALRVSAVDPDDGAIWGTYRALIANMVLGVSDGWSKALELNGVGFRMEVTGSKLKMRLGFSHEILYEIPESITATIENNILTIAGIDNQLVGQVAAEIRAFKKPEPYKGKGFRYTDEVIRRKAGKAAKSE